MVAMRAFASDPSANEFQALPLAPAVRISTHPADPVSRSSWYTVDIYVSDGRIEAVALDLWEP